MYGFVAFSSSPRHIYRHILPIVKPQAPPFTSDMSDTSPWNNFFVKRRRIRILTNSRNTWVFPKIGVPQNGWLIMENLIKMDDLGVPAFKEAPISECTYDLSECFLCHIMRMPFLTSRAAGLTICQKHLQV